MILLPPTSYVPTATEITGIRVHTVEKVSGVTGRATIGASA